MPKAACLQNNFIPGGTTKVTLAVIEVLNDLGVVPDVYCFEGVEAEELNQSERVSVNYHLKFIPDLGIKSFGALKGIYRNLNFSQRAEQYKLVFNADSYLMCFPDDRRYFHYILYPRRVEIKNFSQDASLLKKYLYSLPLSLLYKFERIQESSTYLVLSKFSKKLIKDHYHIPQESNLKILYPPVKLDLFRSAPSIRSNTICSVGSFDPSKNQLEQIELASQMPSFQFLIMGTTCLNKDYYRKCQRKVEKLNLSNVQLLPDIPREKLIVNLQKSRFFLHTKEYEPFGIAAVEAAAAGCLPIVHNSGGQVETVPFPELRFDRFEEIPSIIARANSGEFRDIKRLLKEHIRKFDQSKFKEEVKDLFSAVCFL